MKDNFMQISNMKKKNKKSSMISNVLKNKTILITGGAGSIGSALAKQLMKYPVKSVRILDVDEHSLFILNKKINDPRLRLLLGNILDKDRIEIASYETDIIIHAAAIKNIEISEFNPMETIDINVNGTVNMIKTVMKTKPKIFLNISTDKAVESTTLYGNTKQLGERITSWAGKHVEGIKFATIRFGNVIETRGNVFEIWNNELANKQSLSITDPNMKRYFFHMEEAVNFILQCIPLAHQGEIFVPKMKSYNLKTLASKISTKHKIIGLRQGEKLNEILISESEKNISKERKDMWIIQPY